MAYLVHFVGRHVETHRHLVDESARAARAGAVHTLVNAVFEKYNFRVLSPEFDNDGGVGFFFADDRGGRGDLLNERDLRGVGKSHSRRARNSDRERSSAKHRFDDFEHFESLLSYLGKMTLVFAVDHFFPLGQNDFRGR